MNTRFVFITLLACVASGALAVTPAVFISEYGEGSGYNKYVEIYNGSGAPLDLAKFELWIVQNGSSQPGDDWPGSRIQMSGTLPDGDVYVACHDSAAPAIRVHADLVTNSILFNGNDSVGLAWTNAGSGWLLIDSVGLAPDNPGAGWAVAGTDDATLDHTLVRTATAPNTNWATSAGTGPGDSEWLVFPIDTMNYVGYHGTAPEQPPFILCDPPATSHTVQVNAPLTFCVIAEDFNDDAISLVVTSGLPQGASAPSAIGSPPVTNTFSWTPTAGGDHAVTFAATDDDGTSYATVSIHVCAILPPPENVWINEIHYDNASTDVGEGVEIAGKAGTDLSQYRLTFYNGANQLACDTAVLSGVIPDQNDGYGTVWYSKSGIQNGNSDGTEPDGVALLQVTDGATNVLQFLSYEGCFAALDGPAAGFVSENIGVAETSATPIGLSLQLMGKGHRYADFTWTGPTPTTPDAVNTNQIFKAKGMSLFIW